MLHNFSVNIGQPKVTPLITVSEAFMVDTHEMLDGRVKVMHVDGILCNVVAPIVGLAVGDATLYATACKPDRKTARMMVSPK